MSREPGNQDMRNPISDGKRAEILAEFSALRTEITTRIGLRNQILIFSLVLLGTLLTFGNKTEQGTLIFLIYPFFSFFLSMAWMHQDIRANDIGEYIRDEIERPPLNIRWQHYIEDLYSQKTHKWLGIPIRPTEFAAIGIFVGTQFLSGLLASFEILSEDSPLFSLENLEYKILFIVDIILMFLTFITIITRRRLFNK